jgi:hypothetical protein
MVLQILVFLLVLGITFHQAVQGVFSALIMAMLSALCAAVAFQYYEPLAATLYNYQPAHADALALAGLFAITLLTLRLAFDRFLPGNVVMGNWPDRVAGGALGLITALIVTGIISLAIQMLPTGPRWLMYRPFDDSLQPQQSLAPFYPDEFTLGLAKTLSAGSFELDANSHFAQRHDNFRLEYWCARNRVEQTRKVEDAQQIERIGSLEASPGSLGALKVYRPEPNDLARIGIKEDAIPRDPLMPDEQGRLIIVRVEVDASARDKEDNWWRLPATHFRLACRRGKTDPGLASHYPVAFLTTAAPAPVAPAPAAPPPAAPASRASTSAASKSRPASAPATSKPAPASEPAASWKPIDAPIDSNSESRLPQVARLAVERPWDRDKGPKQLTIDWVYRVGRDEAPEFVAFRRTARQPVMSVLQGVPEAKGALERAK